MGLFSPGKGGGDDIEYGYKGKSVTQHLLVEGNGMPLSMISTSANSDEKAQVINLLAKVRVFGPNRLKPRSCPNELEADKGYDPKDLREKLKRKGIKPIISRRVWQHRKQSRGRKPPILRSRFKVERCFAWMQRMFRRLCIRWERRRQYWNGLLQIAITWMWVIKLQNYFTDRFK